MEMFEWSKDILMEVVPIDNCCVFHGWKTYRFKKKMNCFIFSLKENKVRKGF